MRRSITLLLASTILSACGGSSTPPPSSSTPAQTSGNPEGVGVKWEANQSELKHEPVQSVGEAKSADGVSIHYVADVSQGSPAIVLVHCWTCDLTYWDGAVGALMKRWQTYGLIRLDLAGHGKSGKTRTNWTMTAFGEDVRAVVDTFQAKKVILVGHSMGGAVVTEAARLLGPDRVAGIVYVDTMIDLSKKPDPTKADALGASLKKDFAGSIDGLVKARFHDDADPKLVAKIAKDMKAADPAIAAPMIVDAFKYDAGAVVATLHVPVRTVHSDMNDANVEANTKIAGDYRDYVVPHVGHWLMLEDPKAFDDALGKAIDSIPAPK